MISSPGIGSGLDIGGIIESIMAVERQPLFRLGVQEVELKTQLSAFGQLKSTVSTFESAMADLGDIEKFQVFAATSSDEEILSASASSGAAQGTFNIKVDRIAENHRLAAATVFADTDSTTIGVAGDTMAITVGSTSFEVAIGDKTLDEIRAAINAASENAGVTASTLQDDTGYHLTLTASDTGSTHAVSVAYSAADPFSFTTLNADRDAIVGFTAADLDAVLTLENTFTVTRSSNTVSDVINGIALELKTPGTVSVDVKRDTGAVATSVQSFINAFNKVQTEIAEMRADVLRSESSSLLSLEAQFRNILNTAAEADSVFSYLFEIGISTKTDGSLTLDRSILDGALSTDFSGVANLFADPKTGFATRFETMADDLLQSAGLFDSRSTSLDDQIRRLEDSKLALEFRLETREATLVAEYSMLDQLVSRMQSTGNFLTLQLDQLASLTPGKANG